MGSIPIARSVFIGRKDLRFAACKMPSALVDSCAKEKKVLACSFVASGILQLSLANWLDFLCQPGGLFLAHAKKEKNPGFERSEKDSHRHI